MPTVYSQEPERLYDLRKTWETVHSEQPELDDGHNEEASRPRRRCITDRLLPEDIQALIDQYCGGTTTLEDLAVKFGISKRSVTRLARKHGTRRNGRQDKSGGQQTRTKPRSTLEVGLSTFSVQAINQTLPDDSLSLNLRQVLTQFGAEFHPAIGHVLDLVSQAHDSLK